MLMYNSYTALPRLSLPCMALAREVVKKTFLRGSSLQSGLRKTGATFEVVEIDVVAHVLLAGVDHRLMVPAGQVPLVQGAGNKTPAALAGQGGLMNRLHVPARLGLVDKVSQPALVLGGLCQVFALLRVVAQVEQQQGVVFRIDKFPLALADHHQWADGAFGHVFANHFIMPLATFEVCQRSE